ncbi:hypothetical protein DEO72_LG2g3926 [Vigna unguiculata]|uniref:Uncharacterized protein n=1 Tax=Vigna unguiculata TaxID=3917 RepID=A0A4D6L523_VIGUN|nr:hypothetical protein DEO72_LG2g3926 [Vigna unguiculata]
MHQQHHQEYHLLQYDKSHNHHQSQTKRFLAKTLIPEDFSTFNSHKIIDHELRIYDALTNLPARGPVSTNSPLVVLPLRISPLVVQLYEPPFP